MGVLKAVGGFPGSRAGLHGVGVPKHSSPPSALDVVTSGSSWRFPGKGGSRDLVFARKPVAAGAVELAQAWR